MAKEQILLNGHTHKGLKNLVSFYDLPYHLTFYDTRVRDKISITEK